MLIELPNGLLDGADLFNYAEVEELKGKQQNYLANRELVENNIGHIPRILEDLTKSFQTKEGLVWKGNVSEGLSKLPSGDLETLLIRIREITFGPKFFHESMCPNCNHINRDLKIELSDLALTRLSLEDRLNKDKREFILPKSKLKVELKPFYMNDLFKALKIVSSKQEELVTSTLALTIKRLGDKSDITPKDLDNIAVSDLIELNKFAEDAILEGKIDTDIINNCSKCNKEFTSKLNCYDPSFFSHTKGFKSITL